MAGKVSALRPGQHTITAHLIINGADKAIEFYTKAFGAQVTAPPHHTPDGKVMHAEIKIGDSTIMLADEFPSMGAKGPQALGGSSVVLNLYAENIDKMFNDAVAAGATVIMPLANQFWGDRYGQIRDPFGHSWALGQHVEDVAPADMERRANEAFAQMAKGAGKS